MSGLVNPEEPDHSCLEKTREVRSNAAREETYLMEGERENRCNIVREETYLME